MGQFLAVAAAHFLALLIPGVDFFLIARTALAHGWRTATGVCVGIATANGIFITAAFTGISLVRQPVVLAAIQLAGGSFLIFIGVAFFRSKVQLAMSPQAGDSATSWRKSLALGAASGLLNPKNALFYLSLAAAVSGDAPLILVGYGVWMFTVVLTWDVFVAVSLGSGRALHRLQRILPTLTKVAGGFLILFGAGMIVEFVARCPSPH